MRVVSRQCFSVLASLLLCAGCASSPPARYFSLEAMPVSGGQAEGGRLVGVGPVGIARYLKRPQMVMRGDDNEMLLDDFNRWAEPLDDALPRVLTSDLAALLPQVSLLQLPTLSPLRPEYRVLVGINRFDVDASGQAILDVQWGLDDGQKVLLGPRRDRYSESASQADDVGSQVDALRRSLEAFARDVAAALADLLAQPPPAS